MKITNLIDTLPKKAQVIAKFISIQESDKELAHIRFSQDTLVNWVPKAIFARSKADLADMSFLEFTESLLVYYGPKLLGENIFRKLYSKKLPPELQKKVSTPAEKLLQEKNSDKKELLPIKAAIALSALAIPLFEYSLNFIKNIFTMKLFKQADFNNIANLNKDKKEDEQIHKKVKASSIRHLKIAGGIFAGCLALSALLVSRGKNSKVLQSISEAVLAPGNKLFKNNVQKAASFNKYFGLDFSDNNGKLGLSRGQLTACVVAGFFGYTQAAKDRGKQNLQEVLYRYPLVGFYVITGSEMFEKGFKSILKRKDSYKDIIGDNLEVPKLFQLEEHAQKLAQTRGTSAEAEFKRLFKQKSTIVLVPLLFSIGFMGLFVAGMSRFFTKYRYNKEMGKGERGQEDKKARR
ncbi:MAG: hypothetical protein PHC64_01740 [Candidatus Gastranaerophilales bacterium]|nr:hypothetical protein [Candidatus Gastranaerophilales bacterium]